LARHGPSWHPSVDSEDEDEEGHVIPAARQTRGSDVDDNDLAESVHSDDDGPEVVDIISSDEEPEESSEDELSASMIMIISGMSHRTNRAPCQRLELAHLRILQTHPLC
jgi:hypothetical protein